MSRTAPTGTIVLLGSLVLAVVLAGVVLLDGPDDEGPADPAPVSRVATWEDYAPDQIAEAEALRVPLSFENDLGMRFVLIPAGTFVMGSPKDEPGRDTDEFQHEVVIRRAFYLQMAELTQGQHRVFELLQRPGSSEGIDLRQDDQNDPDDQDDHPVALDHASAVRFAVWKSSTDDARNYRLPTEEEWEYACRAGTTTPYWWGEDGSQAARYEQSRCDGRISAWSRGASRVGTHEPNPWGLFDMAGNLSEYCADPYAPYPGADREALERHAWVIRTRPAHVVLRGGDHNDAMIFLRSAWRGTSRPEALVPDDRRTSSSDRRRAAVSAQEYVKDKGVRYVSPLPD